MFDLKVLAQQDFNTRNILEYSNIEESFFLESLQFISENMNEYRDANKTLYKSILESQSNQEIINESFNDFFQSVKKIIDKFIKYIKSLFERFVIALNKFISSDKFILKHKNDLMQFTDVYNFTINGFNYTFAPEIPLVNAQARFEESFVKLDFAELQGITDQKTLLKMIKTKYNDLINQINGEWYNKFRGEIIGKNPIEQEDYAEELSKVYRNGEIHPEIIEVNNIFIINAFSRFENFKKVENEIKRTKEKLEKDYENIKKHIQNIIKQNSTRDINKLISLSINSEYDKVGTGTLNVSTEVMNQLDLFIKKKVEQIMEMSSIHSLAFSYKLDAVKECYKQDKAVLYRALSIMAKPVKENAFF